MQLQASKLNMQCSGQQSRQHTMSITTAAMQLQASQLNTLQRCGQHMLAHHTLQLYTHHVQYWPPAAPPAAMVSHTHRCCSYFAHTIRMQLHVNMRQYNYTVYVTTGKIDEIRATFNKLRLTPGVMPARSASPADTACENCTDGITAGQPTLGRNPVFGKPANYSAFDNVEVPRNDAAGSGSSAGAGGGASAPVAVTAGRENQGSALGGQLVQVVEGQASSNSNTSEGSSSDVKAAVTSTATGGANSQGDALLGAGEEPPSAGADAASRAAGAVRQQGSGADGKTIAGAVVAAFVGCALLAGTALVVMRSKKAANNSDSQQPENGQDAVSAGQVQEGGHEATAGAAAAASPAPATPTAAAASAASPRSAGVLTRSRAALAQPSAQDQGTGFKGRISDA
jgi:hypothetical protein